MSVAQKTHNHLTYSFVNWKLVLYSRTGVLIFTILTIVISILWLRLLVRVVGRLRVGVIGWRRAAVRRLARAVARVARARAAATQHPAQPAPSSRRTPHTVRTLHSPVAVVLVALAARRVAVPAGAVAAGIVAGGLSWRRRRVVVALILTVKYNCMWDDALMT